MMEVIISELKGTNDKKNINKCIQQSSGTLLLSIIYLKSVHFHSAGWGKGRFNTKLLLKFILAICSSITFSYP